MSNKIVINQCYGGFGLSDVALEYIHKQQPELVELNKLEGYAVSNNHYFIECERHKPILVETIEKLGEKANTSCSKLVIVEIESDQYRIDEYDGFETLITPADDLSSYTKISPKLL
jgi:hypothetical protein